MLSCASRGTRASPGSSANDWAFLNFLFAVGAAEAVPPLCTNTDKECNSICEQNQHIFLFMQSVKRSDYTQTDNDADRKFYIKPATFPSHLEQKAEPQGETGSTFRRRWQMLLWTVKNILTSRNIEQNAQIKDEQNDDFRAHRHKSKTPSRGQKLHSVRKHQKKDEPCIPANSSISWLLSQKHAAITTETKGLTITTSDGKQRVPLLWFCHHILHHFFYTHSNLVSQQKSHQ